MSAVEEVRPDLLPRLKKAGEVTRSRKDAWQASLEQLKPLVVEAIDNGIGQQETARVAGISRSYVNKILTESQPDMELVEDDPTIEPR